MGVPGRGRGRGGQVPAGKPSSRTDSTVQGQSGQVAAQSPENPSSSESGVPTQSQDKSSTPGHSCGMCGHEVGDDAIGCDKCSNWVHPTEMCSGLPKDAISTIANLRGDAILFVCTNCRVKSSNTGISTRQGGTSGSGNDQLIQQLFLSVKGICSAVMELTSRMDRAFSGMQASAPPVPLAQPQPQPSAQPRISATTSGSDDYRSVIRQEMREMQERAKRKQSIIIKGLHAQSPRELAAKFGELSLGFTGVRVELSDIVPIPNHTDLYRAKILDDEDRKLVLERAKSLKDTEYKTVFIRRDLTYAQRQELRDRRAQRAEGEVTNATHEAPGSVGQGN